MITKLVLLLMLGGLVFLEIWGFYELIASWRSGIFKTRFKLRYTESLSGDVEDLGTTSRKELPVIYWLRMVGRIFWLSLFAILIYNWTPKLFS